jgi:tryptophanyl-tRNA synthetase
MSHPEEVEAILLKGAAKARKICTPFMQTLRQAVGLRGLGDMQISVPASSKSVKAGKSSQAGFKQYRESDGLFYFKLMDAHGNIALLSQGFSTPQEAGAVLTEIKNVGAESLQIFEKRLKPMTPLEIQHAEALLKQMI